MQSRCFKYFGLLLLGAMSSAVLFSGCEAPEDPMIGLLETNSSDSRINDLSRTMDMVFAESQSDIKEFSSRVSTGLNRWSAYSAKELKESAWEVDETVKPILESFKDLPILQRNGELSFLNTDASYLQEAVWVGAIADRVSEKSKLSQQEFYRLAAGNFEPDEDDLLPMEAVTMKLHPNLDEDQAADLASAITMFDWVVRNIQLEEVASVGEDEVDSVRLNKSESLPAAGVPGEGYTRYLWQAMAYGRGDYVERAKLFLAFCNHREIEAVMLGIPNEEGEDRLWAVAVVIGDNYYLFDTKLGMPIPGSKIGSVATLDEVRSDEKLLQQLDLDVSESLADETKYWVKSDQLDKLDGLLYFAPEAVSRRMLALEASLVGDQRLPLTSNVSERIEKMPKKDGVSFKPWEIAFLTHQFRQAVRESLAKAVSDNILSDRLQWHYRNEQYIDNFPVYRTAKVRFFQGKFETDADNYSRDAIQSFRYLMYTDETIQKLGSDSRLQQLHGIRKGDSLAAFQRRLISVQSQMKLIRKDAGLLLSQAHFDNGSVATASNWLPKLVESQEDSEDGDDEKPAKWSWNTGTNYLYGRALESQHDYDAAIEMYKKEGAQLHGNLIRARLLKELIKTL